MDPFTYAAIMIATSIIITSMMMPSAQNLNRPPEQFNDFDFPQAEEGTPQCVFFGECWSPDWTVLGVGDYRTTPIYSDGGGK
jgi:hypothetical protein